MSNRVKKALGGSSRGVTLIEALVAMAIVGIIAVAFLGGLATAARSAAIADIRTNAESLARSELEYAKSQDYVSPEWHYELTSSESTCTPAESPVWCNPDRDLLPEYAGYTVMVRADDLFEDPDNPDTKKEGIQIITVTVSHHSREEAVIILSGYKVDR